MILVPPEAPTTERTLLVVALTTMVGVIEDNGRLPGLMKLAGLGGTPKALVTLGDEKSSISSFRMMPVCSDVNPAPKLAPQHPAKIRYHTKQLCFYYVSLVVGEYLELLANYLILSLDGRTD